MPVPVVMEDEEPSPPKSPDDTMTSSLQHHERRDRSRNPSQMVPSNNEEWDDFLNRYSFGEFFSHRYPSKQGLKTEADETPDPIAPPSPLVIEDTPPDRVVSVPPSETERPPLRRQGSSLEVEGSVAGSSRQVQHTFPSPVDPRFENATSGSQTPSSDDPTQRPTDYHPDTSQAGPSNQDPDIPNLNVAPGPPRVVNTPKSEHENHAQTERKIDGTGAGKRAQADSGRPDFGRHATSEETMKADHTLTAASLAANATRGPSARHAYERDNPDVQNNHDEHERATFGRRGSKESRRSKDALPPMKEAGNGSKEMRVSSGSDDPEEQERITTAARARRAARRTLSGGGSVGSKGSKGSRGSKGSHSGNLTSLVDRVDTGVSQDVAYADSASNTSASVNSAEVPFDFAAERERLREFYVTFGYLPAPRQPPDQVRRRLRAIRRLGLDDPENVHRATLDRFTRLAASIFRCSMSAVTVVGSDYARFPSEVGLGVRKYDLDVTLCCHSILSPGSGEQCMVVPNTLEDWRFQNNPMIDGTSNNIRFYAGAPLRVGAGTKTTVIGTLCILDDKPREFGKHGKAVLQDLAECVVSELELLYNQRATLESAKLHQISVDFLRRSLQVRPTGRPGKGMSRTRDLTTDASSSRSGARREQADSSVSETDVDIYDEACREIRLALDAYAVAIVDLSQFHLFYPAYQSSSVANSSTQRGSSLRSATTATGSGIRSFASSNAQSENIRRGQPKSWTASSGGASGVQGSGGSSGGSAIGGFGDTMAAGPWGRYRESGEEEEAYGKPDNPRTARQTYSMTDVTMASRTPQVLFVPHRRRTDPKRSRYTNKPEEPGQDDLTVLGYSCEFDNFVFNFTSSPAARRIISDFIANNVKTRRVWYARDDSEGIAQSITHLMPPGTETSMAMPVFGFDGQVAFAVVACWTDPLYTYPTGAMQFVETIAGSLLASVMKERLHHVERAQLSFAAAASHELRTPLHQLNAAAAMLRQTLGAALVSPSGTPPLESTSSSGSHSIASRAASSQSLSASGDLPPALRPELDVETRKEAISQLEIIESNGSSLGTILENIIDTLDIGRGAASRNEDRFRAASTQQDLTKDRRTTSFSDALEAVVDDVLKTEVKARRVAGAKSLDDVEVILEVIPRSRGGWLMTDDAGPLSRALSKIVHNAVKFTDEGYIHITVQDVSREAVLPAGYDNSIKMSTVSIDIKDSGCGMSAEFLEKEVLEPFTKADPFMPGSGLGLGLAQRMVEILGGKLAIASTLGQGTLVHIEVPLHLLSWDHESDQEDMEALSDDGNEPLLPPVRQDGIYLAGFGESRNVGERRVGKCLLRQLKHNLCRVVNEIHFASLIVTPAGVLSSQTLAKLVMKARPGAQVILLDHSRLHSHSGLMRKWPMNTEAEIHAAEYLARVQITRLHRPLTPSLMQKIMEPPPSPQVLREHYVSDVVGGSTNEEAAKSHSELIENIKSMSLDDQEVSEAHVKNGSLSGSSRSSVSDHPRSRPRMGSRGDSFAFLNPSPVHERENFNVDVNYPDPNLSTLIPTSPTSRTIPGISRPIPLVSPAESPDLEQERATVLTHDFIPSLPQLRPVLRHRQASDPFPLFGVGKEAATSGTSSAGPSSSASLAVTSQENLSSEDVLRPKLRDIRSTPAGQAVSSDPASPVPDDFEAPYKVLVVEDNAVNRKILTTMLRRSGTRYAEAVDGFDAVEKFLAFSPDLVLLDINMPRKDGFEAAAEMRQLERDHRRTRRARIIAVTAMSSEKQKRRGLIECGIDEWKTKPVSIRDLKRDVEALKLA